MTYSALYTAPPHLNISVELNTFSIKTWYGNSPGLANSPPTIRTLKSNNIIEIFLSFRLSDYHSNYYLLSLSAAPIPMAEATTKNNSLVVILTEKDTKS